MTVWSILRRLKVENRQTWLLENWIGDLAVIVNFPLEDDPNTMMVAWTTTPWTLPSNLALCVHPDLVYVKVQGELTFCNISLLFFFSYTTQSQSLCYSVGPFLPTWIISVLSFFLTPRPCYYRHGWLGIHICLLSCPFTYSLSHFHCMYVRMCECVPVSIATFHFSLLFLCLFVFLQKRAAVYITLTRMGHNKVVYWQVYGLQKL